MKIGRLYGFDEKHGRHVADLALSIYDALQPLHGLEEHARELLEAAALLHDVGYHISHSNHHKHSLYLIQNSEIFGFTNEEIAVMANVARYHRKSHPKGRHPEFAALRRSDQQLVRCLAAILRIADGLDRTHTANVQSVETIHDDAAITFTVHCAPGCVPTFEIWSVTRKKELMEEVFGRAVFVAGVTESATAEAME
jgi:exopolyphosphatase/guanosine-5'-triphosphate,3'-diphosphate pyrophosphatase